MLRPKGLDHVGLTVTDMDKTLDFYQVLGLEVLRTPGPDAEGGRSAVVKVGGQELIEDLRQAGVSIVRGPVERRDGTSVFVHDPDGVRVELRLGK